MDQKTFSELLKDLMNHVYDYAALETHPLADVVEVPESFHGSRAEYIQQIVSETIEWLRPAGREPAPNAPEWRPYLILKRRYIEGVSPQDLAAELHLSERQLRRDQSRALQALASHLWDKVFQSNLENAPEETGFKVQPVPLDLNQVIEEVLNTLHPYVEAEGVVLEFRPWKDGPIPVLTDRIILRQILFSLCNFAFYIQADQKVHVSTSIRSNRAYALIQTTVEQDWADLDLDEYDDTLDSARSWAQQVGATLVERYPSQGAAGSLGLELSLPGQDQPVIMVVDDQQPTLRMYQRYLGRTHFKVIGVSDPTQVLSLIPKLKPALILLDVMMPHVDGWEILQNLRLDSHSRDIPVIVCSAWESGEMAKSLGASDFLKKPITQKGLLQAMENLGLPV